MLGIAILDGLGKIVQVEDLPAGQAQVIALADAEMIAFATSCTKSGLGAGVGLVWTVGRHIGFFGCVLGVIYFSREALLTRPMA